MQSKIGLFAKPSQLAYRHASSDIVAIFNNDVWKIILQYIQDNVSYTEEYIDDDGYESIKCHRTIEIKEPFFTWACEPGLFKLFILSPKIAKAIDLDDHLIPVVHAYAMQKYFNAMLEPINRIERHRHRIASFDVESSLNKIRDKKCSILSFGIYLLLLSISATLITTGYTLDVDRQTRGALAGPGIVLGDAAVVFLLFEGIRLYFNEQTPIFSRCSPYKRISADEYYLEKVNAYSFINALPKLANGEPNLKITEIFASFLEKNTSEILNCKVKEIGSLINGKFNASLKKWHKTDPKNIAQDASEVFLSKIKSFQGKLFDTRIEVLDNEEEKHASAQI